MNKQRSGETKRCESQNKANAFRLAFVSDVPCCCCWMNKSLQKERLNANLFDVRPSQDLLTTSAAKEQDVVQTCAPCVMRYFHID